MLESAPPAEKKERGFSIFERQNMIMIFIGCALAIDYTVVMVSLPNYWANVAPTKSNMLGFVVGVYDLSQFLFAPIFGALSDVAGLKRSLLVALLINIVGNVIYSFGIVVGGYHGVDADMEPIWGTDWLLIVGRFTAGIGSAALGLSAIYFTRTTSAADRQLAMAAQQAPLTFARAAGPSVGTIITIFMPQHLTANKTQQTFNFLTSPGWLCVGISVTAFIVTALFFKEPDVFVRDMARRKRLKDGQKGRGSSLRKGLLDEELEKGVGEGEQPAAGKRSSVCSSLDKGCVF
jgi:MFS family permease